jgi:hypothetical protein
MRRNERSAPTMCSTAGIDWFVGFWNRNAGIRRCRPRVARFRDTRCAVVAWRVGDSPGVVNGVAKRHRGGDPESLFCRIDVVIRTGNKINLNVCDEKSPGDATPGRFPESFLDRGKKLLRNCARCQLVIQQQSRTWRAWRHPNLDVSVFTTTARKPGVASFAVG